MCRKHMYKRSRVVETTRPSLTELALRSERAMIIGNGGGGDIILTIPLANYLETLGLQEVYIGGVGCQWWTPSGQPVVEAQGAAILGPTVYPVEDLENATKVAQSVASVTSDSHLDGRYPAEAIISRLFPWPAFVVGLTDGVVGMVEGLLQVIRQYEIDLFISVDAGSDSFHTGDQVRPAQSALVDLMTLATLIQLPCSTVFALAGYGLDGELALEELDQNVSSVMKNGGFLGAYGLTQRDVQQMLRASEAYPDPIEYLIPRAAMGEFGLRRIRTASPWGTIVRVSPLAAILLFFDPTVLVECISRGALALMHTKSLTEAEGIYEKILGQLPESRLARYVDYLRGPE
jgi:hypothetical protein